MKLFTKEKPVAYFSAEFAIESGMPIYAGGLGVLAGDILKEAADLGINIGRPRARRPRRRSGRAAGRAWRR